MIRKALCTLIDKCFKLPAISFFKAKLKLKLNTREINPLMGLISHAREIYKANKIQERKLRKHYA